MNNKKHSSHHSGIKTNYILHGHQTAKSNKGISVDLDELGAVVLSFSNHDRCVTLLPTLLCLPGSTVRNLLLHPNNSVNLYD